jgi:hypothetical protein
MIDHKDCDPGNNAISNLRESCKSTNGSNRGPQRNNTSGFKGVKRRYRRWIAQIHIGGRNKYLGSFARIEDAAAAYAAAAAKEFGEFSRTA